MVRSLALLCILLFAADSALAQSNREEWQVLNGIRKEWEAGGPSVALRFAEQGVEDFPEDVEIMFSVAALREMCNAPETALAMYERIVDLHGTEQMPDLNRTVAGYTLMPRYRLLRRLGKPEEALSLARENAEWLLGVKGYNDEPSTMKGALSIVEAEVFADDLEDYPNALKALQEAEESLRDDPLGQETPLGEAGIIWRQMLYRQCRYDMLRLQRLAAEAGEPLELPADLPGVTPTEDFGKVGHKFLIHMVGKVSVGGFHLPTTIGLHEHSASYTFRGFVGQESPSRALRALACYEAGVFALEKDDLPSAIKWLTVSSESDTYFSAIAAAKLTEVAVAHAARLLSVVEKKCPPEVARLRSVREDAAASISGVVAE